jgi:hypothetical protein
MSDTADATDGGESTKSERERIRERVSASEDRMCVGVRR